MNEFVDCVNIYVTKIM